MHDFRTRNPKGFMHYGAARCDECGKSFIKRQRTEPVIPGWEECSSCEVGTVLFTVASWDTYLNLMEDGAVLVVDL